MLFVSSLFIVVVVVVFFYFNKKRTNCEKQKHTHTHAPTQTPHHPCNKQALNEYGGKIPHNELWYDETRKENNNILTIQRSACIATRM